MMPVRAATTAALFIAIPLIALAVLAGNGALVGPSFDLLHAGVVILAVAVAVRGRSRVEGLAARATPLLAIAAVGACVAGLVSVPPGLYLRIETPAGYLPYTVISLVAAVLAGTAALRRPDSLHAGALVAAFAAAGAWLLANSPEPAIDVWVWHQDALAALVSGGSPYAITIPNIYPDTAFYGPGVVEGGRVLAGYPYPPLPLLAALPGWLVAGDYRWAFLLALAASGWLIARAGGRWAGAAASLLLFHPRALFIVEQGWTEPVTILALSLTMWAAARRPRWLPWAAGLLLASKQHLVLLAPLVLLLVEQPLGVRGTVSFVAKMLGTVAATWAPFVAWDPGGVVRSAFLLHLAQPFRPDALSYLPWLRQLGLSLPGWTGLALACPLAWAAAWRAGRGRARFAVWFAAAATTMFALGKQAFANYWYLVGAAACWGVAESGDAEDDRA